MHRRWRDGEEALHVGLGRRAAHHQGVGMDEGDKYWPCFSVKPGFWVAESTSHRLITWASNYKEAPMNIRYRVDLTGEGSGSLSQMLSAGKHAVRRLKRAQILLAADADASDDEIERSHRRKRASSHLLTSRRRAAAR